MRRIATFAALAIAGCGVDAADTTSVDQAAPPDPYEFAAGEVSDFGPVTATVAGVAPGSRIVFLGSPNGLGSGPCPPQLGGGCIDLAPPVVTIAATLANADGWSSINFPVPASLGSGDTVAFQAVVRDAPGAWTATQFVERPYGPTLCPAIFAPECGVDNDTYPNGCSAAAQGMVIDYAGPCL